MPDINGIPYVESSDLVSAYPAASQALAQEVSDQLAAKGDISTNGAWATWTPAFTQSTALTTSVNVANYVQVGKIVHAWFTVVFSNSGTSANNLILTNLPVNAISTIATGRIVGAVQLFDASTNIPYAGNLFWISNSEIRFVGDWSGQNAWGLNPNLGIASGDSVRAFLTYEAA